MRTVEICTRTACIRFAVAIVLPFLCATAAHAQLNGENLRGDMGVKSGTQPESGLYVSTIYYRYRADSLKDAAGRSVNADPTGDASQTLNAGGPLLYYV